MIHRGAEGRASAVNNPG